METCCKRWFSHLVTMVQMCKVTAVTACFSLQAKIQVAVYTSMVTSVYLLQDAEAGRLLTFRFTLSVIMHVAACKAAGL